MCSSSNNCSTSFNLRRVEAWVEVNGAWRLMAFITNNTEWSPRPVRDLYRRRWERSIPRGCRD
jgi:hypothetical protein